MFFKQSKNVVFIKFLRKFRLNYLNNKPLIGNVTKSTPTIEAITPPMKPMTERIAACQIPKFGIKL